MNLPHRVRRGLVAPPLRLARHRSGTHGTRRYLVAPRRPIRRLASEP